MTVLEFIRNLPGDTRIAVSGEPLEYLYLFDTVEEAIQDNQEYLTHEIISSRKSAEAIIHFTVK